MIIQERRKNIEARAEISRLKKKTQYEKKYLSLNESTEQDIIEIVEKHGHLDHSRSAHLRAQQEEATTGVFK